MGPHSCRQPRSRFIVCQYIGIVTREENGQIALENACIDMAAYRPGNPESLPRYGPISPEHSKMPRLRFAKASMRFEDARLIWLHINRASSRSHRRYGLISTEPSRQASRPLENARLIWAHINRGSAMTSADMAAYHGSIETCLDRHCPISTKECVTHLEEEGPPRTG